MCFSKSDVKLYDNLMRPLELNTTDRSMWNDKCDYNDVDKCENLNPENYNLVVLQHNIRSLLAHKTELKMLLNTHKSRNSTVDILLLSETFLTKLTESLVNIPGYTLVSKCRNNSKGGGVKILLKDSITYKL